MRSASTTRRRVFGRHALVDYKAGRGGTFTREWSFLDPQANVPDLLSDLTAKRDAAPVHYALLTIYRDPVSSEIATGWAS